MDCLWHELECPLGQEISHWFIEEYSNKVDVDDVDTKVCGTMKSWMANPNTNRNQV